MNAHTLRRFVIKVEPRDECWVWMGCRDAKGYGNFWNDGRVSKAHRVSYEHFIEPIPSGLQIDHLCLNKSCVNPAHLEAVTGLVNAQRRFALQTHCKRGHELAGPNIRLDAQGYRSCLVCEREVHLPRRLKRRKERRRAARALKVPRTHCRRGHPLVGDNLYVQNGSRTCVTCKRDATRRFRQRQREGVA